MPREYDELRRYPRAVPLLKRLRRICLSLPGAEEVTAWGHPNFRAGSKTFAVLEAYRGELMIAVKVGLASQRTLTADPRYMITPYIGKHGWVSLRVGGGVAWNEVTGLVLQSYRLVAAKGMLKALDELG
jgi:predicted DNA-binding protein (MmcQ/YjbR family)